MSQRFTIDGSDDLEATLRALCVETLQACREVVKPDDFLGLLLGGGYGRGEGGVLKTEIGDAPYNDLEFYLFVAGNLLLKEREYRQALHERCEKLSHKAGIEVEVKIINTAKIASSEVAMFYYDLVMGHRWISGDAKLLSGTDHHRAANRIPLHEATRLLMNRTSGLLYARERLQREQFTPEDLDFVGRNISKAQLGLGDAILAALGQYHWSCQERGKRLVKLASADGWPWPPALLTHHAEGIRFKLHPTSRLGEKADLQAKHGELSALAGKVWLWLEEKRLKKTFSSAKSYALDHADKAPETRGLKNRLVNARAFGIGTITCARYPRTRLLSSLPLLLWESDLFREAGLVRHCQTQLRTDATDLPGLVKAYEKIWQRFN